MSVLMTSKELLYAADIEPIFEGIEAKSQGVEVVKTVVGTAEDGKIARIKRVSTEISRLIVDIAFPSRFEGLVTVYSSTWDRVKPVADPAVLRQMLTENRGAILGVGAPDNYVEEILFQAYDDLEQKVVPGADKEIPDIHPNIYTVEGMLELIQRIKFREILKNE